MEGLRAEIDRLIGGRYSADWVAVQHRVDGHRRIVEIDDIDDQPADDDVHNRGNTAVVDREAVIRFGVLVVEIGRKISAEHQLSPGSALCVDRARRQHVVRSIRIEITVTGDDATTDVERTDLTVKLEVLKPAVKALVGA